MPAAQGTQIGGRIEATTSPGGQLKTYEKKHITCGQAGKVAGFYSRWGMATARGSEPGHANLRLREKLVFFDNSGNGHFAVRYPVLHANYPTLAQHSDAFGQRDLRWQSQGEGNG
jgi:hypothetical protein